MGYPPKKVVETKKALRLANQLEKEVEIIRVNQRVNVNVNVNVKVDVCNLCMYVC